MGSKKEKEEGLTKAEETKKEITAAALELFFEKGYENTSIRMIQKKAGREIGTFYYHFASKDDVMEAALELFFEKYEDEMRLIVRQGKEQPEHCLLKYLNYIEAETQRFRKEYLAKLHWSITGAIREHTILIMRKYIEQIIQIYVDHKLIEEPEAGVKIAANELAFAIGGSILYQTGGEYRLQKEKVLKLIFLLIGIDG